VYPNGIGESRDQLGLYFEFADAANAVGWSMNVKWIMRLINQRDPSKVYHTGVLIHEFCAATPKGGWPNFITLKELKDPESGWIHEDSIIFEVEILDLDVLDQNHLNFKA